MYMTIKTILISVPFVLAGWITTLALATITSDEAPAYMVLLPSQHLLLNLRDDTEIFATSMISVTLTSDANGFVSYLYKNGAWLVLPAGLAGCLSPP